jgi:hypothetical protein
MYALAAGAAGVGLLALTPSAHGKIVYTPAHVKIAPFGYVRLDLNHDRKVDFVLDRNKVSDMTYVYSTLNVDPYLATSANGAIATAIGTDRPAIALRKGARIGPKKLFNNGRITVMAGHGTVSRTSRYSFWSGQWAHGGKGLKNRYLDLKFAINGRSHYGWARVTVTTSGKNFTALLTGYAYETIPNKPIIAGKTKSSDEVSLEAPDATMLGPTRESASLGLLAMGTPGLSIWRQDDPVVAVH